MKELTAEEIRSLAVNTVIYDRYNDPLWCTSTGLRYSVVSEDGSYLETSAARAVDLWGPLTLDLKGPEWEESVIVRESQSLIDMLTEIWEEADRNTQNLMVEMIKDWYLKRTDTPEN